MLKKEVLKVLPLKMREVIEKRLENEKQVFEIRLRCGREVLIVTEKGEVPAGITAGQEDMRETVEYISGYSLYAYEEQLREGFITIRGGHRVGIAGKVVTEDGKIKTIKYISSINIRVSHQVIGCSDRIIEYVRGNVLIVSPPRMGKTTLLRDILRQIGNRQDEAVAIVDERSEIAACYMGVPQHDLGARCDVLDCCPKAMGMMMLLRTMSPTYIGVDELGRDEDIDAVMSVVGGGAKIVATIHGESLSRIKDKEFLKKLFTYKIFDTYVELSPGAMIIYDSEENIIYEGERKCHT